MIVRIYKHGSSEYEQALELRRRVLREPLGLVYTDQDLAEEIEQIHIGAFEGERILGTLILVPHGSEVRMRQVAVAPEFQGRGIGRDLVMYSETLAKESGFSRVILHARETAVKFYEGLGYACEGGEFTEVTIPHRAMSKIV